MTNPILCVTTLASIVLHFIAIETTHTPAHIVVAYYVCLFSSLANHASSSKLTQWFDRCSVGVCALMDVYLIAKTQSFFAGFLLVCAVAFYMLAKKYKYTVYHVIAHGAITYAHIWLLQDVELHNKATPSTGTDKKFISVLI